MLEVIIRKYEERDRDAVIKICADSGFLGNSIDTIFCDRKLFSELMIGPYLWLAPEHALVAELCGNVVGYRVGTTNPRFEAMATLLRFITVLKIAAKYLVGKYAHHQRSKKYVEWLFKRSYRELPKRPCVAHGHYNVVSEFRGKGIGTRMLSCFEEMLRKEGVGEYYREMYSYCKRDTEQFLLMPGCTIVDKARTTVFYPEIPEQIYLVCGIMKLK